MFVLRRNQVIITALVVMIAIAGYLSWSDSRDNQAADYMEHESVLVPHTLVGLFPDEYEGLIGLPWFDTHDPTIAVYGDNDDIARPILADLELSELIQDNILATPTAEPTEAGEAIFVNTDSSSSFFVQARLNREQSRSGERSVLNDLINNANVAVDQRAQAADAMLEIQRRIERETAAEALIESKGFAETYVRISDNGVDVIVSRDTLTEADLAQIMDIIKRKTGLNEQQIHISPIRR